MKKQTARMRHERYVDQLERTLAWVCGHVCKNPTGPMCAGCPVNRLRAFPTQPSKGVTRDA
jgi:hypothetical protein